jgi:hypothetical protein
MEAEEICRPRLRYYKVSLWLILYYGIGSTYLHEPNDENKYLLHVLVFLGTLAFD